MNSMELTCLMMPLGMLGVLLAFFLTLRRFLDTDTVLDLFLITMDFIAGEKGPVLAFPVKHHQEFFEESRKTA